MTDLTEAIIYPASKTKHTGDTFFRKQATFYTDLAGQGNGFGSIREFNNDTLGAGHTFPKSWEQNTIRWILPLVGSVQYENPDGRCKPVEPGEMLVSFAPAGSRTAIRNPHKKQPVNFLEICFCNGHLPVKGSVISRFDLETNRNRLVPVCPLSSPAGLLGKFDGRKEEVIQLPDPQKGAFVYVVHGAFEVQHRLIESGDGLALWNTAELELEALSNEALLLVILL